MDDVTYDQVVERMTQLQGQPDAPQLPSQQLPGNDRPLVLSDAQELARQLDEYLRELHNEDLESDNANNAWLQQIDTAVKAIRVNLMLLALLIIIMPLIVRSCGG